MWLTTLSIRRPLLILMALLAIMLGGAIAYRSMPVSLLPSIKFPFVVVTAAYPGAGPREVEERVTKPIENAVAGAPGLKRLTSNSGDGYGTVMMEFRDGIDPDTAAQDVERRVSQMSSSFPEGVKQPSIAKYDLNSQPIVVAGVTWDRNPDDLYRLVDETIRPRIEAVDGVALVQLWGGREREIRVSVDRARLESRGLSLAQVTGALAAANLSAPSGYLREGSSEYSLRVYGLYQELDQLKGLVISSTSNGSVVRLQDVAEVEDSFKTQSVISRVNGRDAVVLLVQKQQTANTVSVSAGVQKAMKELAPAMPEGVEIATVMDEARFVKQSLDGVQGSLRDAVLIVALVLLLFLHTWRSTLIVLVSIPTSLVATFGVMWAMGFSMNMMSMMGLALTIGILVDDSIVILENIHRHASGGDSPWVAAFHGRAEIGAAAVAITLVDVVVYTPLAFLNGMTGQFFKEFGGSVVVATLFSLLVSFTLTPMLASRWMTAGGEERSPLAPVWRRWESGYQALERGYRRLLGRTLGHRWLVLLSGVLAFAAGIAILASGAVGSEFMPQSDQGMFTATVNLPAGTSLEGTNAAVRQLEAQMAKLPEIDASAAIVGVGGEMGGSQARSAEIFVNLKPLAKRTRSASQVAEEVRRMIASLPGMKGQVTLASMVGGGAQQPIVVSVRGSDVAVLTKLANQVEEILRRTPGTIDVTNGAMAGAPEMRVQIDHQRLSDLGLTTAQVASALRTGVDGTVATELRRESEDKVDVRVVYAAAPGGSELAAVLDIPLTTPNGARVKLGQVASLAPVDGPAEIKRVDRTRQVTVGAGLSDRPLGDVTAEVQKATAKLALPAGYKIVMTGDSEAQNESFGELAAAMGISVVLMYMLMAALFNSLVYPMVILFALPLASVGSIGALALSGDTLNVMSLVGLIMLTGLVAKNAILMVDYTNTLRKQGLSRREALQEAGPTRLRPILMTTMAMICAMIPMALKIGEGAESRSPMAMVVIGGLISSTLLTLVVVPAGYTLMDDLQGWVQARLGRKTADDRSAREFEQVAARAWERTSLAETRVVETV